MNTNVDDFFEKARNIPLKNTVEGLVEECPIDFFRVFKEAKKLTLEEAGEKPINYKERNYMAETMYGNVIGVLMDNYPQYMKRDAHSRPYVALGDNVRIYIKKLTEKYIPNNIKTKNVKKMNAQELFAGEDQVHIVYAGFVLTNKDWALDFREVCLSYLNKVFNKSAAWLVDLSLERFRKGVAITTYMDTKQTVGDALVTVPGKQEDKTGTENKQ